MRCKSSRFDGYELRKCRNPAKRDGFCMVHHPESVKRRAAREAEKCMARQENSIITKHNRLLAAAKLVRPFIEDGEVPKCFWSEPFKSALDEFDAAISKCET